METPIKGGATISPPVFYTSAILITALVIFASVLPETAQSFFGDMQAWIVENVSWFYVLAVALILLSTLFMAASRYGDIKLGPDHSQPDYKSSTWFAMLFSAGMGIGLMFFGVAEPVMHFIAPPVGPACLGDLRCCCLNSCLFLLPSWLTADLTFGAVPINWQAYLRPDWSCGRYFRHHQHRTGDCHFIGLRCFTNQQWF